MGSWAHSSKSFVACLFVSESIDCLFFAKGPASSLFEDRGLLGPFRDGVGDVPERPAFPAIAPLSARGGLACHIPLGLRL